MPSCIGCGLNSPSVILPNCNGSAREITPVRLLVLKCDYPNQSTLLQPTAPATILTNLTAAYTNVPNSPTAYLIPTPSVSGYQMTSDAPTEIKLSDAGLKSFKKAKTTITFQGRSAWDVATVIAPIAPTHGEFSFWNYLDNFGTSWNYFLLATNGLIYPLISPSTDLLTAPTLANGNLYATQNHTEETGECGKLLYYDVNITFPCGAQLGQPIVDVTGNALFSPLITKGV